MTKKINGEKVDLVEFPKFLGDADEINKIIQRAKEEDELYHIEFDKDSERIRVLEFELI